MSTRGLTVTRVPSPIPPPCQSSIASASAPGVRGPANAPNTTASTTMPSPTATTAGGPWRRPLPTQVPVVSCSATRCRRMKARAAAMKNTVAVVRWPSEPSRATNTTIADAGRTASTAEPSRKAAQSATHAATHTAMHAPSTKPGSAGAGATTSPNCVHASRRSWRASENVSVLGRPRKVVSR